VAEAIAAPLETQLNGVDHMLYMESTSSDAGTYNLSLTFAAVLMLTISPRSMCRTACRRPLASYMPNSRDGVQVRKRATNLLMG
jgi:hypothetical protein